MSTVISIDTCILKNISCKGVEQDAKGNGIKQALFSDCNVNLSLKVR